MLRERRRRQSDALMRASEIMRVWPPMLRRNTLRRVVRHWACDMRLDSSNIGYVSADELSFTTPAFEVMRPFVDVVIKLRGNCPTPFGSGCT